MSSKVCLSCNEEKPLTDFNVNRTKSDGRHYYCRVCQKRKWKASYDKIKNSPAFKREMSEKFRKVYQDNPEYYKKYRREYNKRFPARRTSWGARYRADKLQATPKWLTEEHLKSMEEFYIRAKELTKERGILYEVDHIMPLKGENSCGLHVPWNLQILTKSENCKKSNKIEEL